MFREWPAFADSIKNSLVVSAGSTLATVAICLFAGYGYARFEGRLLRASEVFLVGIRMLPPIVITVPLFPAVNLLNLADTWLVLIIIYTTFYVSLGTLIMNSFIAQIPRELDDAARVDGAGTVQIVTRIIAPIAMSGLIAVGIFVFIYAWNEFIFAFIFTSTNARTGPLMVSEMLGALDGIRWGVVFAAVTLQIAPVLLLVSLAQRYIISGLTSGSVKG